MWENCFLVSFTTVKQFKYDSLFNVPLSSFFRKNSLLSLSCLSLAFTKKRKHGSTCYLSTWLRLVLCISCLTPLNNFICVFTQIKLISFRITTDIYFKHIMILFFDNATSNLYFWEDIGTDAYKVKSKSTFI